MTPPVKRTRPQTPQFRESRRRRPSYTARRKGGKLAKIEDKGFQKSKLRGRSLFLCHSAASESNMNIGEANQLEVQMSKTACHLSLRRQHLFLIGLMALVRVGRKWRENLAAVLQMNCKRDTSNAMHSWLGFFH
eukprot:scaffold1809_cov228-Pinguiococcus_pyrenoidosus.AAC.12